MAELAYAQRLGRCLERVAGSNPAGGTNTMIYLLYGPNSFTKHVKRAELVEAVKTREPDVSVRRFWLGENGDQDALREFISSRNLFGSDKKVAIVTGINAASSDIKKIIQQAAQDPSCIMLCDEDFPKKQLAKKTQALFKDVTFRTQFFGPLSPPQFLAHLKKICAQKGIVCDDAALRELRAIHGDDLFAIMNDIERLWLYDRVRVTAKIVQRAGSFQHSVTTYEFVKTLVYKAPHKERLRAWERFWAMRPDPFGVFGYLAKALSGREQVQKIAHADMQIKQGRLDAEQALLALVLG